MAGPTGFFDQAVTSEGPTLIRPGSAGYNSTGAGGFAASRAAHFYHPQMPGGVAAGSLTSRSRPHPNCRRSFGTELTNL